MRRAAQIATATLLTEEQHAIQAEIRNWEVDLDHSIHERTPEIRSLKAQLAALEAESLALETSDPTRSRPDEIVAYLRSLILDNKLASTGRVWVGRKRDDHPEV